MPKIAEGPCEGSFSCWIRVSILPFVRPSWRHLVKSCHFRLYFAWSSTVELLMTDWGRCYEAGLLYVHVTMTHGKRLNYPNSAVFADTVFPSRCHRTILRERWQNLWHAKNCRRTLRRFIFVLNSCVHFALRKAIVKASCQIVSFSSFWPFICPRYHDTWETLELPKFGCFRRHRVPISMSSYYNTMATRRHCEGLT
jgi:hypothetical protein